MILWFDATISVPDACLATRIIGRYFGMLATKCCSCPLAGRLRVPIRETCNSVPNAFPHLSYPVVDGPGGEHGSPDSVFPIADCIPRTEAVERAGAERRAGRGREVGGGEGGVEVEGAGRVVGRMSRSVGSWPRSPMSPTPWAVSVRCDTPGVFGFASHS